MGSCPVSSRSSISLPRRAAAPAVQSGFDLGTNSRHFAEPMSDTTRTFIALAVPETLNLRLTRLQQQLAGELSGVRWSTTPPFHVTLAFLGDVSHSDLVAVCRAVEKAVAVFAPFSLKLDGIGAFPDPTRPRVIWTGISGPGVETLRELQGAIAKAVARVNYATDSKPYHPHVTLGRAESGRGRGRQKGEEPTADMSRLISHYRTWHAGPFPVSQVITFASASTREGPSYTPLGRGSLKAKKADIE